MKTLPSFRNEEDIQVIVRGMQALDEFTYYTIDVQKKMARYLFYEEYGPNRTIFKEGNNSDFMYFIVMGACKDICVYIVTQTILSNISGIRWDVPSLEGRKNRRK